MFSRNYVNIPNEIEELFLQKYGPYVKFQEGIRGRKVTTRNQASASDITIYSAGNTFLVDMAAIWEKCYSDCSFGMFKKEFFEHAIEIKGNAYHVSPRVRVEIRYTDEHSSVMQRVEEAVMAISEIFRKYKGRDVKQFTQHEFEADLAEALGRKAVSHDKIGLMLDIFTENVDENAAYVQSRGQTHVLRKRKQKGLDESVYFVSSVAYARLPSFFNRQAEQCAPNNADNSFFCFYPLIRNKQIEIMPLLRLLELLGLATYEIRGGEKAEVFIRINDPVKLESLAASGKYTNHVLQSIQEHHRRNERLMSAFFMTDLNTKDRWELGLV